MTYLFIGVDPGANGGIAIITERGEVVKCDPMPDTDQDIRDLLLWPMQQMPLIPVRAMVERVRSSPQLGVVRGSTFGGSYRALKMALTCCGIPYDEITPFKWQRRLECISEGNKRVLYARPQTNFPRETEGT